jgi:uncharacterized membrane protein
MKPLYVLLLAFFVCLFTILIFSGDYDFTKAGKLAMSVMLVFTALGHFMYPKGMAMMIPDFIPYKNIVVLITGFIEIAAAIGLLIPSIQELTSILLIIFFVLILPANINAAMKNIDYENASKDGPGILYLWFRIPMQLFLIGWVWYFFLHTLI